MGNLTKSCKEMSLPKSERSSQKNESMKNSVMQNFILRKLILHLSRKPMKCKTKMSKRLLLIKRIYMIFSFL